MLSRSIVAAAVPALALAAGVGLAQPAAAQRAGQGELPDAAPPFVLAQNVVVVAPSAPPAPQTEVIPAPPADNATMAYWQPGHWTWNGATWVWVGGNYVMRPQPTAVWVPGQWAQDASGSYRWVDGHWQG
jgi:WXXGXW repeat (2 copies)